MGLNGRHVDAGAQLDAGEQPRDGVHDRPVGADVWELYRRTLLRTGPVATLIEWDNDVPSLATLIAEARKADRELAVACAPDRRAS